MKRTFLKMAYYSDDETTQEVTMDEDLAEIDEEEEGEEDEEDEENEYEETVYEATSDQEEDEEGEEGEDDEEDNDEDNEDNEEDNTSEQEETDEEPKVVEKRKTKKIKVENSAVNLPRTQKNEIKTLKKYIDAYVDLYISDDVLEELTTIKLKNGEYLLDRNDYISMEVVSMFAEDPIPDDEIIEFLKSCQDAKQVVMNQMCMLKSIINNNFERYVHIFKEEGVTDVGTCPKCHNKKLNAKKVQMRSGDEGMNIHFGCPQCGYKWSV